MKHIPRWVWRFGVFLMAASVSGWLLSFGIDFGSVSLALFPIGVAVVIAGVEWHVENS